MVVGEPHLARVVLAPFGRHEDGSVDRLVAIQCHGRCVLQHRDGLHLLRTDEREVTLHAVDEEQRGAARQALQAADVERRFDSRVVAGILQGDESQPLSQQRIGYVLGRAFVECRGRDRRDCHGRLSAGKRAVGAHVDRFRLIAHDHLRQ